ncbi:MAG: hypothetical protein HYT79_07050 [Elusimicrobia bacterium]|nr:hypothetical protein [Elusimicrobiota bacterium]
MDKLALIFIGIAVSLPLSCRAANADAWHERSGLDGPHDDAARANAIFDGGHSDNRVLPSGISPALTLAEAPDAPDSDDASTGKVKENKLPPRPPRSAAMEKFRKKLGSNLKTLGIATGITLGFSLLPVGIVASGLVAGASLATAVWPIAVFFAIVLVVQAAMTALFIINDYKEARKEIKNGR